jgi:hypothetical protein
MEVKDFLTGLLSKTLNMDEAGVASLLNEDGTIKDEALSSVLELDVKRIGTLKPDTKKYFDDGYKKASSEILTKRDKELSDKFGIKSDKIGVDLVNEIISEQVKKSGAELNEDGVKKHPVYIAAVDKLTKEKEEAISAESNKLTQFQSELKKKDTFNTVANKAMSIFNGLKPILSSDTNKAENQKALLTEKLSGYEYDIQGDQIIVLKEGKILEDKHGNRIPFETVVKTTAETYYDFHVTDPKQAPANGKATPNGTAAPKSTLVAPKSEQEYNNVLVDSKIPVAERLAFQSEHSSKFSTNQ